MKKTIAVLFALATAIAFAGQKDLLITFSTPGPDKYADGTTVLDGESYALVWTPNGGGESITVLTAPFAKDGRCMPVLFSIDEKNVSKYNNGTWGVYLLDSRDYEKDPTGKTLAERKDGQPVKINVKAPVAEGIANTTDYKSVIAKDAVSSDSFVIPNPTVTGIKVDGAFVYVTVKDIVPCLEYTLKSSGDTTNFAVPEGVEKDAESKVTEITLRVPKQDGAQFFKVTTK